MIVPCSAGCSLSGKPADSIGYRPSRIAARVVAVKRCDSRIEIFSRTTLGGMRCCSAGPMLTVEGLRVSLRHTMRACPVLRYEMSGRAATESRALISKPVPYSGAFVREKCSGIPDNA